LNIFLIGEGIGLLIYVIFWTVYKNAYSCEIWIFYNLLNFQSMERIRGQLSVN